MTGDTWDGPPHHEEALDEIVYLMTKAGPFASPRDRAAHLLSVIEQDGTHTTAYLSTLDRAKRLVRDGLTEGVTCPCCGQRCQEYHRTLNAGMAAALITVSVRYGHAWVHVPDVAPRIGGDFAKLRHWALVEESLGRREDGGRRGEWRVTNRGEQFVRGVVRVPRYVSIYNNLVVGLDGPEVDIRAALGDRFDYDDLMRRAA